MPTLNTSNLQQNAFAISIFVRVFQQIVGIPPHSCIRPNENPIEIDFFYIHFHTPLNPKWINTITRLLNIPDRNNIDHIFNLHHMRALK